jgi:hypothetical protein
MAAHPHQNHLEDHCRHLVVAVHLHQSLQIMLKNMSIKRIQMLDEYLDSPSSCGGGGGSGGILDAGIPLANMIKNLSW